MRSPLAMLRRRGPGSTAKYDPDHADRLSDICVHLRMRGELERSVDGLSVAVEAGREAVAACPPDHPHLAGYLSNLGLALRSRFELGGDVADADEAVVFSRRAVDATRQHDPVRGRFLNNLGVALATRQEQAGLGEDPDEAVETLRRSVQVTPRDDPEWPMYASNFGRSLIARSHRTGAAADLEEAVAVLHEAVAVTDPDDPALGARRASLDEATELRDRVAGGIDAEIAALRQELASLAPGDPDFAPPAATLSILLSRRFFETTGDPRDLDDAVELCRQAVAVTAAGDRRLPGRLSALGGALAMRAERSGDGAELDEAIDAFRASVAATPPEDVLRSERLANLALALKARHDRNGDLPSIREAADAARASLAEPRLTDADRAGRLSNLGLVLTALYERNGAAEDLDDAIAAHRGAVALTPETDVHHAGRSANLSIALQARATAEDVEAAVDHARQAVAGKSPGDEFWPDALNILGLALRARAERGGPMSDLDEAVEAITAALVATSPGDARLCSRLANLSVAAHDRYRRTGAPEALAQALWACREGVGVTTAPPRMRAGLGARWGHWAAEAREWELAVEGFAAAIALLAEVAGRDLSRHDQEHSLSQLGSPATSAAACCLEIGDARRAVELWEQGRGVLLGQALDIRTDVTDLADRHPADAARFAELRDRLDALPVEAHQERHRAAVELARLIADVRGRPGFERFLLPPPLEELLAVAGDGPVVLINVHSIRSDALILTPDRVDVVPLPEVGPEAVVEHLIEFLDGLEQRAAGEELVVRTLEWLYDAIARPVLDRVGVDPPASGEPRQRIWWCPSGLLAFLPLHAAGRPGAPSVLDSVVSSYTPTLRALRHARRPVDGGARSAAVIAMRETPGAGALPGAAEEAAVLRELLGSAATVLEGPAATRASVLNALPAARWAHFACHGESPPEDPAAGRLLLHDHATAPLLVSDVMRLSLEQAELAFLSACETARTGTRLPDEATHMAAAFQLAGYRNVIATLWPIADRAALLVAQATYEALVGSDGPLDAAGALHRAVRRLRAMAPDRPSVWAAFIHSGA